MIEPYALESTELRQRALDNLPPAIATGAYVVAAGLTARMLFGTDLPWFAQHRGIGAILSADISDADRHNMLHRNAERLLARFPGIVGP